MFSARSDQSSTYQFLEVIGSPHSRGTPREIPLETAPSVRHTPPPYTGDVQVVHESRSFGRTVSSEKPFRHWREAPPGQTITDSYLGVHRGPHREPEAPSMQTARDLEDWISRPSRTKVPFERTPPKVAFFASTYDPPRNFRWPWIGLCTPAKHGWTWVHQTPHASHVLPQGSAGGQHSRQTAPEGGGNEAGRALASLAAHAMFCCVSSPVAPTLVGSLHPLWR